MPQVDINPIGSGGSTSLTNPGEVVKNVGYLAVGMMFFLLAFAIGNDLAGSVYQRLTSIAGVSNNNNVLQVAE